MQRGKLYFFREIPSQIIVDQFPSLNPPKTGSLGGFGPAAAESGGGRSRLKNGKEEERRREKEGCRLVSALAAPSRLARQGGPHAWHQRRGMPRQRHVGVPAAPTHAARQACRANACGAAKCFSRAGCSGAAKKVISEIKGPRVNIKIFF